MKKNLLLAICAVLIGTTMAWAQPRAIGLRLGLDPQLSYEHQLGKNMLSVDAGIFYNFHGAQAALTYDFLNPFGASFDRIWDGKGEWNWYLGVGAGAGFAHWNSIRVETSSISSTYARNYAYVGVAGRVGVEYNFWFPLQLSLDWRPVFGPGWNTYYTDSTGSRVSETKTYFHGSNTSDCSSIWIGGVTLGVRYKF